MPNDVFADLVATFEGAGLSAPPIPPVFVPKLRKLGDWCYATREIDPGSMYMLAALVDEVFERAPEDYVAVSHAGHGVNSYSINYALVSGPLALFLQTGWGGVYMDADRSAAKVREMFAGAAALIDAAGPLAERPGRLLVFSSDFSQTSTWGWTGSPGPSLDLDEQLRDDPSRSPLTEALEWVRAQS